MRRSSTLGTLVLSGLIVAAAFVTVEAQGRRTSRHASPAATARQHGHSRPVSVPVRANQHGNPRLVSHMYGAASFGMRIFYPWGFYSPWYFPPYPYSYGAFIVTTVRIQAEPKNAEVYVDGRFAGVVDDFDGFFQGLRVEPGGHELRLYLEGYRSVSQRVYVGPGENFKWRTMMERLAAGEANEPLSLIHI